MLIKLFHGTSTACIDNIKKEGLSKSTYLTSDDEQAQYYAECAAEEDGSKPHLLVVLINTDNLEADLPSFNEPLTFALSKNGLTEEEWHAAIEQDEIPYPELSDWRTSLQITESVYHRLPIPAKDIFFEDADLDVEDYRKINDAIENTNSTKSARYKP